MKKFLRYFFVFIFVVIATAFGTIKTNSLLIMRSNENQSNMSNGDVPYVETEGEKILNALISMGGADFNFQFDIRDNTQALEEEVEKEDSSASSQNYLAGDLQSTRAPLDTVETIEEIKVTFTGRLSVKSLDNISLEGTLVVNKSNKDILINISYLNKTIYVSNEAMSIKFTTENLSKITELLPLFGLDIDLDSQSMNFDTSALLTMLQNLKSEVQDNGDLLFSISISDDISLSLITDTDYVLKSIFADKIKIKNKVAVVSAQIEKNEEVDIVSPEETQEQEYVDVTQSFNLIDNVKEIMTNKQLRLNVECDLVGTYDASVKGTINIDFASNVVVFVDFDVSIFDRTYPLSIMYKNGNAFVSFNGKKMLIEENVINELVSLGSSLLEENSSEVTSIVTQLIPNVDFSKLSKIDLSNIDINNFLSFAKGEDDEILVTILGENFGIEDLIFAIKLDENGQLSSLSLDNVNVFNNVINARITYSNAVYLPEIDETEYVVMQDLPNFIKATMATIPDVLSQKYLSTNFKLNVNMAGKDFAIEGLATVDFGGEDIKVYLATEIVVKNRKFTINVALIDGELFVQCENFKFKATKDDLADILWPIEQYIDDYKMYEALRNFEVMLRELDISKSISQALQDLPQKIITKLYNNMGEFGVYINRKILGSNSPMLVKVNYNSKITSIDLSELSFGDLDVVCNLELTNQKLSFDIDKNEYISLSGAGSLVNSILTTYSKIKKSSRIPLEVDVDLAINGLDIHVSGQILYQKESLFANLSCEVKGLPYFEKDSLSFQVFYQNGIIYVDFEGLKVKFPLSLAQELISKYAGRVDFKSLIQELLPNFNFNQILSGDLSSLKFDIIKAMSLSSENLTIVLDKNEVSSKSDIKLSFSYAKRLERVEISGVDIQGCQMEGRIDFLEKIVVPQIKDDYSDLSNVPNVCKAIKATLDELTSSKRVAFSLGEDLAFSFKTTQEKTTKEINATLLKDSFVEIDFGTAIIETDGERSFDVSRLSLYANLYIQTDLLGQGMKNYNIELTYLNGIIYANYNDFKVKVEANKITDIISSILDLLGKEQNIELNFDMSKLTNVDLSKLNLGMIKLLSLSESELLLNLDLSELNVPKLDLSDVQIRVGYDEKGVSTVSLNKVILDDITVENISIKIEDFKEIAVDDTSYMDLNNTANFVKAIKATLDELTSSKRVAFSLGEDLAFSFKTTQEKTTKEINATLLKDSFVEIDFGTAIANGEFDIMAVSLCADLNLETTIKTYESEALSKVSTKEHVIKLVYVDKTLYLCYNSLSVKVKVDTIDDFVNEVFKLIGKENNFKIDFDFSKLKDMADPSSFSLKMIKSLSLSNSCVRATFDLSMLKVCDFDLSRLEIVANYDESGINDFSLAGINDTKIKLGNVALKIEEYQDFEIDDNNYVDLETAPEAMKVLNNTVEQIGEQKTIAFDLKTDLIYTQVESDNFNNPTKTTETIVTLLSGSNARFDWTEALSFENGLRQFDAKKFKAYARFEAKTVTNKYSGKKTSSSTPISSVERRHSIELTYINNVVYIRYNNMYIKIGGDNIKQIAGTVMELMGIETNADMDIDISKLLNYSFDLSMLSDKMIKSMSFEQNVFNICADLTSFNILNCTLDNINVKVSYSEDSLRNLVIQNFAIDNISVSKVDISMLDFFTITSPSGNYIDLSSVDDLLKAVNNMKNYTDFEVEGSVNLKIDIIGIKLDWNVPVNVKVKLLEDNKYEISAVIGTIPVVAGVNDDVPYKFGNTVKSGSPGLNRKVYIYIKDDMVYIYRNEKVPVFASSDRTYEKKLKAHIDTVLDDPLYYLLQFGFGFSQDIMDAIYKSLHREKNPIDYSNVLKGFGASGNYYALTLNLKELSQDDKLDTMTLGVRTSQHNGNNIITGFTVSMDMPVASGVDINLKSDNLNFKNIGGKADMSSLYSFVNGNKSLNEGVEWGAYNGDWKETAKTEFELRFTTYCNQTVNSIKGLAGTKITLPTLNNFYKDTADGRTYYTFAGWYTTENCLDGTEYADNIIPRRDTMLYAKWDTRFVPNMTISFSSDFGKNANAIIKLEGEKATLPTLSNYDEDSSDDSKHVYYTFEGWYTSPTFEENSKCEGVIELSCNMTLYAKWNMAERKYTSIYFVSDVGESKANIEHVLEGEKIVLPTYDEDVYIETDTECMTKRFAGWYVDQEYLKEFSTDIMPSEDTILYAKWEIISKTRKFWLSIYDGSQLLAQKRESENEELTIFEDMSQIAKAKCTDTTEYYKESNFVTKVDMKGFTMPSEDTNLYVRNKYTLKAKSVYGNTFDTTKTCFQGETINLQSQKAQIVVDYDANGNVVVNNPSNDRKSYQKTYTFKGYQNKTTGEMISGLTLSMPIQDTIIEAVWTVTTKKYYTLTFSKETDKSPNEIDSIIFPVYSCVFLEDTVVNLNDNKYRASTWTFKVWRSYWHRNFQGWSNEKDGNKIDSITMNGNKTVYARWNVALLGKD